MLNILEALYWGKTAPYLEPSVKSAAYIEAERLKHRNYDTLVAMLNESQKEQFDKYNEAAEELERAIHYSTFTYSLKFGALLMAEVSVGANQVTETNT